MILDPRLHRSISRVEYHANLVFETGVTDRMG